MDRRTIEQMFLEEYGYIGSQSELEWFISKYGGDPYLSNEEYRLGSAGRYEFSNNNTSDAGGVRSEFSALFKEIISKAKEKEMSGNGNELILEFAFMVLLFLIKASLFFALRFGEKQGYCCSL